MAVHVQPALGQMRPTATEVDVFRHVAEQAAEEALYRMLQSSVGECDVTIAGVIYHITVQDQQPQERVFPCP